MTKTYFPTLTRRELFRAGAVTVTGGALAPMTRPVNAKSEESAAVRGGAECVIVVNLVGGPSQMDTFDVKEYPTTPEDIDIRTTHLGYRWPYGLLPKTAEVLDDLCVVRSMGALSAAEMLSPSTARVSAGSITPSSHSRALA